MSQKPFEAEVTRIYNPDEARMKKAVKIAVDYARREKAKELSDGGDKPAA